MHKNISIEQTILHKDHNSQTNIKKRQLWSIFFLGFSSGLPFLLVLSTLSIWLAESGVNKTQIGLLTWVTLPYTLKFLWAPLVDSYRLPILDNLLGQRRSWLLLSQIMLLLSLIILGSSQPQESIFRVALSALLVCIFSATQDIIVEAYRIELLQKNNPGFGASSSVLGYRLGMLCAGAGAIYLASFFSSWKITYNLMAGLMLVGIFTTLIIKNPVNKLNKQKQNTLINNSNWVEILVLKPLKSLLVRQDWWFIILFIIMYKSSDTVLNVMGMPFLLEIGFDKVEIAQVAKTFGIIAMIFGGAVAGWLFKYYALRQILFFGMLLQLLSCILFIWQARLGHDLELLFFTMGVENFSCGLGQVTLLVYLSNLCSQPHTALHYAILSSFASLVRINWSMLSGWLADQVKWPCFYSLLALGCLLTMLLLWYKPKHFLLASNDSKG